MASEIRVNSLSSRAGLSTVTFTDTGPIFSGITTFQDNSGFNVGTGGSIFSPASNTVTLGTNNAERLRIASNGNIGIDCTPNDHNNFTRALDVNGPSGAAVYMRTNDSTSNCFIAGNYGSEAYLNNVANGNIRLYTQGTERLRITNTGNIIPGTNNATSIGDGTTNFASIWASTRFRGNDNVKLILGNSQDLVIRHDGTNNIIGSPVGGDLHIKSGTGDNDNQLIAAFKHSNASVGIGTDNPDATLKVNVASGNNGVVVQNTSTANIALFGARNGDATVQIGQWGSTASGSTFGLSNADLSFIYTTSYSTTHPSALALGTVSNKPIVFATNNTERLRVTSDGKMGLGTASPNHKLTLHNSGTGTFDALNITSGLTNSVGLQFGIDSASNVFFWHTANGGIKFATNNVERARVTNNGITFNGDTAADNALNDYEQGTWNPTIAFGGSSTGVSYSERQGVYVKIGNLVWASIVISLTSNGTGTGDVSITLPFAVGSNTENRGIGTLAYFAGFAGLNSNPNIYASSGGATTCRLQHLNNGGGGNGTQVTTLTHGNIGNTAGIRGALMYTTM